MRDGLVGGKMAVDETVREIVDMVEKLSLYLTS
jgi:hypothetical protein